jgi:hypothetical protein
MPLLLDEMHSRVLAAALRELGHDLAAVTEQDALRTMTDGELYRWAGEHGRRIVTENVKDFAPLLRRGEQSGQPATPVLFTSSRTFPRSRRNPGPLINALDAWLRAWDATARPAGDWLTNSG